MRQLFWETGEFAEGWYIDDVELVRTTCGNNVLELGEVCDDGNVQDGDGCSSDCSTRSVLPWIGSDSGTLVTDRQCPAGSLGVGFATSYTNNRLESMCLICRSVGATAFRCPAISVRFKPRRAVTWMQGTRKTPSVSSRLV